MARINRDVPTYDFDLLYPIDMSKIEPTDDCFGKEWSPEAKECSVCADVEVCGIVCSKTTVKTKISKAEKDMGPFIDQFKELTEGQLEKAYSIVKTASDEGDPISTEEMQEYFEKGMKIKDAVVVVARLQAFKAKYNLKVRGGFFYAG